jgi:hypothetical protein
MLGRSTWHASARNPCHQLQSHEPPDVVTCCQPLDSMLVNTANSAQSLLSECINNQVHALITMQSALSDVPCLVPLQRLEQKQPERDPAQGVERPDRFDWNVSRSGNIHSIKAGTHGLAWARVIHVQHSVS